MSCQKRSTIPKGSVRTFFIYQTNVAEVTEVAMSQNVKGLEYVAEKVAKVAAGYECIAEGRRMLQKNRGRVAYCLTTKT